MPARTLLALFAFLSPFALVRAQSAPPTLESEDTFTYAAESIVGRNGGSGWAGAWFNPYSQQPLSVNASGQLVFTGTSTIQAAGRTLSRRYSAATVSSVYVLFDAWLGSQSGGGTPTFRLFDTALASNQVTGAIGNNGYSANYSLLGVNLSAGADSGVSLNSLKRLLLQVDYVAGQSYLWIGDSAWDMTSPPSSAPSVSLSQTPTFDRFELYVRGLQSFDNLRVYSTPVPEPAGAAACLGLAAWAALARRRRRAPLAASSSPPPLGITRRIAE